MNNIIVVTATYNSAGVINLWSAALQQSWANRGTTDGELQAIVVDNHSTDDTVALLERYEWVTPIHLAENLGFARACNIGISHASEGDLVILLNPDVEVAPTFFAELRACQIGSDVAAIGPRIVTADGRLEHSARRFPGFATGIFGRTSLAARIFPHSAFVRRELLAEEDQEVGSYVDWVSGACMIVPAERFSQVGPLDPGYFMYWEDADWCRRAHEKHLRVRYEPTLCVRHTTGSSARSRPLWSIWTFHMSAFRYYRIHTHKAAWKLPLAAVALAAHGLFRLVRHSINHR